MRRSSLALIALLFAITGCGQGTERTARGDGVSPYSPSSGSSFSGTDVGQPLALSDQKTARAVQRTPAPVDTTATPPATSIAATASPTPPSAMTSSPSPTPRPPRVKIKPTPAPAPAPDKKPSVGAASRSGVGSRKSWGDLAKQYGGHFALRGGAGAHRVALSFDDAPDERYTEQVLNVLRDNGVKATFFVVGSLVEQHPQLVRRMKQEGHVIGNHTSRHKYLPKLSQRDFEAEVQANEKTLESIVGYRPRLIRPPYGEISEPQLQWAAQHHYMVVNWDVDSHDWSGLGANDIMHNVIGNVRDGSIILQHAGTGPKGNLNGTVQALPRIITELKQKGYDLVTIPELLQVSKSM